MTLKYAVIVTAIIGVLALFWFNAVSALPFLYTPGWHQRVEKHIDKVDSAMTEFQDVRATQRAMAETLVRVERTAERQADETAALRKMFTDYLAAHNAREHRR